MITQKTKKLGVVVTLGVIYFISFWLLTIGYFTPYWLLVDLSSGAFDDDWYRHPNYTYLNKLWRYGSSCNSIGLVKPTHNCDATVFNRFEEKDVHGISHILKNVFILMTTAVVVVYTNAMMLGMAVVFDFFQYTLYTSMMSISFGVCYPVAAILILVATIYVEASYRYDTGFSTMLCTIAGCLMLFFYIGLILYDQTYIKQSSTAKGNVKKSKHGTTERKVREPKHSAWMVNGGSRDLKKLHSGAIKTKSENRTMADPQRSLGLRRN